MVEEYYFCLYVAGDYSPNSIRALNNLRQLFTAHLTSPYRLEVVDIIQNPDRAELSRITATPTLEWLIRGRRGRLVGDFSDSNRLISLLE